MPACIRGHAHRRAPPFASLAGAGWPSESQPATRKRVPAKTRGLRARTRDAGLTTPRASAPRLELRRLRNLPGACTIVTALRDRAICRAAAPGGGDTCQPGIRARATAAPGVLRVRPIWPAYDTRPGSGGPLCGLPPGRGQPAGTSRGAADGHLASRIPGQGHASWRLNCGLRAWQPRALTGSASGCLSLFRTAGTRQRGARPGRRGPAQAAPAPRRAGGRRYGGGGTAGTPWLPGLRRTPATAPRRSGHHWSLSALSGLLPRVSPLI